MIKKLRKKFIMLTAFTLLGVILTLIIAINTLNIYKNEKDLNHKINIILDNQGRLPEAIKKDDVPRFLFSGKMPVHENKEMTFTTRFCVINFNKNKEITDIYSDKIAAISNDEIREYAKKIVTNNKKSGWINNYKYKLASKSYGYMLVILDASMAKEYIISILLISTAVVSVSYLIILLIIILCSNKAIKPIAESYEKQKQFITDASHELKTPLTIISANSEILEMTYGQDEWIYGIQTQVNNMSDLVNNLVTLARLDEENMIISFNDFCISDVVLSTSKAFEGLCKNTNKTLNLNIEPNIKFKGNEAYIRQLTSILLDNACKYCDTNGDIYVTLRREKQLIFSVSNSYAEVKNIDLERLVDRFYKVDKSRTKKGSYGLGLSIAQSIINSHNGKIEIKNIDDRMIKFIVKL